MNQILYILCCCFAKQLQSCSNREIWYECKMLSLQDIFISKLLPFLSYIYFLLCLRYYKLLLNIVLVFLTVPLKEQVKWTIVSLLLTNWTPLSENCKAILIGEHFFLAGNCSKMSLVRKVLPLHVIQIFHSCVIQSDCNSAVKEFKNSTPSIKLPEPLVEEKTYYFAFFSR